MQDIIMMLNANSRIVRLDAMSNQPVGRKQDLVDDYHYYAMSIFGTCNTKSSWNLFKEYVRVKSRSFPVWDNAYMSLHMHLILNEVLQRYK